MSLKRAQRRSYFSKLREKVSPSQFLEKFSPTFNEQMGKLRELDNHIRDEANKLNAFLKIANKNLSRKEYLKSFAAMVNYHDHIKEIDDQLMKFKYKIKAPSAELLSNQLTDEEKALLLKSKPTPKKATVENSFVKEAGLLDFIGNLFNKRYWALSALESKFSDKELKKFKNELAMSVGLGSELFGNLKQNLKVMSVARATRSVSDYFSAVDDFHRNFKRFDKQFLKTAELVEPFIKHLEDMDLEEKRREAEEAAKHREEEFKKKQEEYVKLEQHRQELLAKEPQKNTILTEEAPPSTLSETNFNIPSLKSEQLITKSPPTKLPTPAVEKSPAGKKPISVQVPQLSKEEEAKQEQAQEIEKLFEKKPTIIPSKPSHNFFKDLNEEQAPDTEKSPTLKAADQLIDQLIKLADQYPDHPQQLLPTLLDYVDQLGNEGEQEEQSQLLAIAEGIADANFLS